MADQIALRIAESQVSAGSAVSVTANFRTRSTGAASTPSSIRYRVDCLTNRQNVINWTSVSAASSVTISVGGTYNAILDEDNDHEQKQLTVEIDTGLSTQSRQAIKWTARNIRTFVPAASFRDDLLLEPYYPITAAETAAGLVEDDDLTTQYEPGDVRRQGTTGDGTTDDGSAVRNALLAHDDGAPTIELTKAETYLATTWTVVEPSIAIRVNGHGAEIQGPSTYADFIRPTTEVSLKDVAFDHWKSVVERESADTGSIARLDVEGCDITDISSVAFNIERPLSNYRWMWNKFSNTDGGYTIRVGENDDTKQDTWKNGVIAFNRWTDVEGASTASTAAAITYGRDTVILANTVDDVDQTGTGEAWSFYGKLRHGIWAFNIVHDIQAAGSTDNTGLSIKGAHRGETGNGPQSYGTLAIGHIAYDIGVDGTRGIGVRQQSEECYSAFCYVYDAGLSGVTIDDDGAGHVGSFFNRIGFTATPDSATAGVRLSNAGDGVRSFGDEIWGGPGIGVRIGGAGVGTTTDAIVVAHDIVTAAQCISINTSQALDSVSLLHNVLRGTTTGVTFAGGPTLVTGFRALDNYIEAPSATTIFSGAIPPDCEIRHCWKFQTTAAGPASAMTLVLSDAAVYDVELKAIAILDGDATEVASYHKKLTVHRDGGNATVIGAEQDVVSDQEVTAAWDAALAVSGNNLVVNLTGEAAHTIDWKLWIHVIGMPA